MEILGQVSGNAMVTAKHTHASSITYPVSMPISYKSFGKYKNIEEKNQSIDDTFVRVYAFASRCVWR